MRNKSIWFYPFMVAVVVDSWDDVIMAILIVVIHCYIISVEPVDLEDAALWI